MISGRVELLSCEAESFTVGVSCREGKRCIPRFQWLTEKDTEGFFLVASMSINLSTSTLMCLFDIYNHLQLSKDIYIYIFTYKTYPCITITYYNHNPPVTKFICIVFLARDKSPGNLIALATLICFTWWHAKRKDVIPKNDGPQRTVRYTSSKV